MTLLTALRCPEGIVLTSDSRETSGAPGGRVAQHATKLYAPRPGFLIAWAGSRSTAQAFTLAMREANGLSPSLARVEVERRLEALVKQIQDDGATDAAEWLIAWWSVPERAPVALHLFSHRKGQWAEEWQHVGDRRAVEIASAVAATLRYVSREGLTVEQAKILALKVMRDTLHVGVESIGGEPQLGAVTREAVEIVTGTKLRALHHTLGLWEEQSAGLLPGAEPVPAESTTPDRGVRPPGEGASAAA